MQPGEANDSHKSCFVGMAIRLPNTFTHHKKKQKKNDVCWTVWSSDAKLGNIHKMFADCADLSLYGLLKQLSRLNMVGKKVLFQKVVLSGAQ